MFRIQAVDFLDLTGGGDRTRLIRDVRFTFSWSGINFVSKLRLRKRINRAGCEGNGTTSYVAQVMGLPLSQVVSAKEPG